MGLIIGFEKKMDYTVIGDPVNAVFRLQNLTKSIPNGILISEKTRRASRIQIELDEINLVEEVGKEFGDMKVFELVGRQKIEREHVTLAN